MTDIVDVTIQKAIDQLQQEKARIDARLNALNKLIAPDRSRGSRTAAPRRRRRGRMSAAQRAAVSTRMKAYWAAKRREK